MADFTISGLIGLDSKDAKDGLDDLLKNGKLSMLGIAAMAVYAAKEMAELAVKVVEVGSEFEYSMAKASTLFGDVAVDVDGLQDSVLGLSRTYGITANEFNEGLYSALSAGVDVSEDMSEALKLMDSSAKLATAGFTDIDFPLMNSLVVLAVCLGHCLAA